MARGEERLRFTVTPRHTSEQMDRLVRCVDQVFTELQINRLADWKRLGGRANVGVEGVPEHVEPIWTKDQVGLTNGTTPKVLKNGEKPVVDATGVSAARGIFNNLLGPMEGHLQPNRTTVVGKDTVELVTSTTTTKGEMRRSGVKVPMAGQMEMGNASARSDTSAQASQS